MRQRQRKKNLKRQRLYYNQLQRLLTNNYLEGDKDEVRKDVEGRFNKSAERKRR